MVGSISCTHCGGPLPASAADVAVACPFCGFVSAPAPKVIERVVERVRPHIIVQDEAGRTTELFCLRCAYKITGFVLHVSALRNLYILRGHKVLRL